MGGGGLFVCLRFVFVLGGRMGGVIVSLGRCVCLSCGGVCRSRNCLLGWSGLRKRERRVLGACMFANACVCV